MFPLCYCSCSIFGKMLFWETQWVLRCIKNAVVLYKTHKCGGAKHLSPTSWVSRWKQLGITWAWHWCWKAVNMFANIIALLKVIIDEQWCILDSLDVVMWHITQTYRTLIHASWSTMSKVIHNLLRAFTKHLPGYMLYTGVSQVAWSQTHHISIFQITHSWHSWICTIKIWMCRRCF